MELSFWAKLEVARDVCRLVYDRLRQGRRRPCTVPYMRSPAGLEHYHLLICLSLHPPIPAPPCMSCSLSYWLSPFSHCGKCLIFFPIWTESNMCRLPQGCLFSVFFSLIRSLIGDQLASLCVPQLQHSQ